MHVYKHDSELYIKVYESDSGSEEDMDETDVDGEDVSGVDVVAGNGIEDVG